VKTESNQAQRNVTNGLRADAKGTYKGLARGEVGEGNAAGLGEGLRSELLLNGRTRREGVTGRHRSAATDGRRSREVDRSGGRSGGGEVSGAGGPMHRRRRWRE
jgi:hypothetical protein